MITWATIENALHAWVVSATGLPASKVIWHDPAAPRPVAPYVQIKKVTVVGRGIDWLDVKDNPTSTLGDGAELLHLARGCRDAKFTLTAYAAATTGSADASGLLQACKDRLPFSRFALNAAGVGIGSMGPILSGDGFVNVSTFAPRATVDVNAFLASEVTATTTFIENADVQRIP